MTNLLGAALAALLALPSLADEPRLANDLLIPGTDTRVKANGTVWLNSWYFLDQNLKDDGILLPGDNALDASATPDRQIGMTARYSRFGFTTTTPSVRWGEIKTMVELDFAGSPGKNGGANLRHAYIDMGRWTAGYTWSNWLDLDASPTTVDMNGPIGQACNGSSRYTQLRYTLPTGERGRLAFSVEQSVNGWDSFKDVSVPTGNGTPSTTTRPDARYPSFTGAWSFTDEWGHLSLRGLAQNYGATTPAAQAGGNLRPNRWGGAGQVAGTLNLGRNQLAGSIYAGRGLGEYGAGLQGARLADSRDRLDLYRNVGWQAGLTCNWTDRVHSGLVLSGVNFSGGDVARPEDVRNAFNGFVNTFVKLDRRVELGMEYGYEDLHTFGHGQVTQRDGSKSDRNQARKLQVSLTAKF